MTGPRGEDGPEGFKGQAGPLGETGGPGIAGEKVGYKNKHKQQENRYISPELFKLFFFRNTCLELNEPENIWLSVLLHL